MTEFEKIKTAMEIQPQFVSLTNQIKEISNQLNYRIDELTLLLASAMSVKDGGDVLHLQYSSGDGEQAKVLVKLCGLASDLKVYSTFLTEGRAYPKLPEMFTLKGRGLKFRKTLVKAGKIKNDDWSEKDTENALNSGDNVVYGDNDTIHRFVDSMRDETYSDVGFGASSKYVFKHKVKDKEPHNSPLKPKPKF